MEGDQFGNVQPQIKKVKLPLRHAGQYADDESGLFYNYFRYYDPSTGRYITSDPIGLEGGLNTFGYVGGSPLLGIDFYGLFPDSVTTTCAIDPAFCATIGLVNVGAVGTATVTIPKITSNIDVDTDATCPPENAILSKGGKQKIDNEYVRLVQYQKPNDPCNFLKKLYDAEKNTAEKKKIKIAMKRYNCDGKNRYDKK